MTSSGVCEVRSPKQSLTCLKGNKIVNNWKDLGSSVTWSELTNFHSKAYINTVETESMSGCSFKWILLLIRVARYVSWYGHG